MRLNWYSYHIIIPYIYSEYKDRCSLHKCFHGYYNIDKRAHVTMSSDTQRSTRSTMDNLNISINNTRAENAMECFLTELLNLGTNSHTTPVSCTVPTTKYSLLGRHNEPNGVSNHQPHDCLLNCLFGHRSKKTSKLRVIGFCAGNSPETGELSAQMASNAENVSIWWRHHGHLKTGWWIIMNISQWHTSM